MADVQDWLDEVDAPDYVREAFSGSGLRKKLEEATARIAQLEPLEGEIARIRKAPVRDAVWKDLGVDPTTLRKTDRHILDQFDWEGDEPDKEQAAAYLQEWGIEAAGGTPSAETPAAQGVVTAATATGAPLQTNDLDAQIADAESKGDWTSARILKTQRAQARNS